MPERCAGHLLSDDNHLLVSAASIWEITIKAASGKHIRWLDGVPPDVLESYVDRLGATRLPISTKHAAGTWRFREWQNKDPFDRMIAAQAIAESATLVTADDALRLCPGVIVLW